MNVSSIVVKTRAERVADVVKSITASSVAEIHFFDESGRIVVTIEGRDIQEEMDKLKQIQSLPYVVSANLAFSYSEEELTPALDRINQRDNPVPPVLGD